MSTLWLRLTMEEEASNENPRSVSACTREASPVTASEVTKVFDIDGAMVNFCFNALNVFQYPLGIPGAFASATPETTGPILIIEDNDAARDLLSEALTDLGYETMTAPDGRTGLAMLLEYSASIVLLDIYLPDTDGVSIARWILDSQPSTVVVLMSGMIEMKEGESLSTDAVKFLPKPFSIAHLEDVLRAARC